MCAARTPQLRRALVAIALVIASTAGVLAVGPLAPSPATAAAPGAIVVDGHGWGHGRGMGQWGAHGYAGGQATGTPWNSDQILDHFYGGTVKGSVASNATVRVWLKGLDSAPTRFFTKSGGLTVGGITVPAPRTARITLVNGQWMLFTADSCTGAEDGGTPVNDNSALPAASASNKDNLVRVCDGGSGKPYRGFLTVLVGDGVKRVVNTVLVDDYLRGVVPAEMPSGWEPAALQSQAVAARSYALAQGGESGQRFSWAKTCDDISCQVYNGANAEAASTDAAIAATSQQVRRSPSGVLQSTEFSASTGGWTTGTSFTNVEDKGDAHPSNPNHSWSTTLDPAAIASKYGLGTFQSIQVTKRNGLGADGGRVLELVVKGSGGSVTKTGDQLRSDFGLKSNWFTLSSGIGLDRLAGADRYGTAAAIAKATYPSSQVALLVRGDGPDSFADGLAANYLAGVLGAPVLLSRADAVPQPTLDALDQLDVKAVRLLGGTAALSANVETTLTNAGYSVQRIAGEDRYATAAAIAGAGGGLIGTPGGKKTAVLSSGTSFPDALAAGGIVYGAKVPQLLTDPASLPAPTAAALTDLGIQHVLITGGTAAVSAAVEQAVQAKGITTERAQGATRWDTAIALADLAIDRFGFPFGHLDFAVGTSFPDALAGGPHAGTARAGVVLTMAGSVPASVCSFLHNRAATTTAGHLFGGPSAIDDNGKSALEACLAT